MAIMFFVMQGWTQTTLNESFEGATFPPEDWTIATTSGSGSWQSSTTMAHAGTKSAKSAFNSNGCTRWLITPKLHVTSEASTFAFWIATDNWYNDGDDIEIFVSTTDNQTSSFSTTPLLALTEDSVTITWAQHSVDLSAYVGQDIYVAIRVTDNYGFSTFIDDITGPNLFVPTCPKPRNLAISNITTTGADLGWTDATGSLWNVQFSYVNDTNWSNATTISGVTTNPYVFTNLNHSTSYKARVQTDCTSEQSEWSTPVSFRTACDLISTLPYTENFDTYGTGTGTYPTCWRKINTYSSGYPYIRSTNHSSPGSLYFYATSGTYNIAITPQFDPSIQINTLMATFYYRNSNATDKLIIGAMSDPTDVTTFDSITTIQATSTSTWQFFEVNLSSYTGAGQYVAFKNAYTTANAYAYVDDLTIGLIPSCPNAYNLTSTLRSSTSVDLNWFQNGNGSGWVIAYGDTTAFDPSTATQTVNISSTDPVPYTLTGLNPQTPYSFAVRQNCTNGAWSNIVSVITPANAATLPYSHSFEDVTENNAWAFINGTQTNQWVIGTAADTLGTNGLYISNDQGVTNAYTGGTSSVSKVYAYRDFEVPAGAEELELSFDWRAKGGVDTTDFLRMYLVPLDANITAGVIPPNGLDASAQIGNYTGGTGKHWLSQSTVWQHKTMRINSTQFPNLAGGTWRLLVHWRNERSTTTNIQPPAAVDNISLTVVPCPSPSALTVVDSTTTSALLRWTENGSATNWIIEYKPSSATTWTTYQTTSNPDSIINLIPGTLYNARVRSLCSDTSLYSSSITFRTVCVAQSVPTPVEGFLTTVPPTTCWTKMQGILPATGNATLTSTTSGWIWNSKVTPHNAKINIYGSSCKYWLISPSVDLGDGSIPAQIEFDVFYTAFGSTNAADTSSTADDRFAVVVSTDDGLTWNAANATIWSNATGATRLLNNIPNTPTHIILPLFDPATTLPYTGTVKIGFYGESTVINIASNDIHIDNFEVLPYTTCQRPTSVMTSNITSTDATVNFTENGSSTSWEYVYGDATTITDPTTAGTAIATTTNPISLTGLTPQTQYNIWVRSICDNSNSDWSVISTFVTEALPATLPYTCDFENSSENLGWKSLSNGVNKWAIGTAAGNGSTNTGTQANYISKDGGTTYGNNYVGYTYSYAYAYRDIDFGTDPASFNLSFDWKCQGYLYQSSNLVVSGFKVYLLDPSEVINLSSLPSNSNDSLGLFYNHNTWQNANIPLNNISGIKKLVFVYFSRTYNDTVPGTIDNISITQESCPIPYNLASSNLTTSADLTTTSAEITWNHPGADSYIVSYRPASGTTLTDEAATASPYTIQGLTLGTQYIVSVRAICSSDTTTYSTTITFQTPCSDIAIAAFPWIEGFENGLNCWQQEIITGTTNWINNSFEPNSGSNSAFFNWIIGGKTKLISPLLDISSLTQPYLSFWHKQEFYLGSQDELKVLYRENADSAWTQLFHFSSNISTYQKDSIALPEASSTYQIAFEGLGGNGNGIYLDDIEIYDNNNCISPTNINIQNITTTSCDISWTTGGQETAWQVRLGLNGAPIDVTTTSYQLTNLIPNSNDTVYVRANCGSTYSIWVSQTFTTSSGYQLPTVTTAQEIGTTQTSTTLNGSYIQGTNPILVKGFQWKQSSASAWNIVPVSAGTTPFVYALNSLTVNTQYEFRAYVETSLDTTYGATLQFTTLDNILPTVTTDEPNQITNTSATFHGTITQGTEEINARGFEYKLPTEDWADATILSATGTTTISAEATNLQSYTNYIVRAYARTASDTYYGQELNFQTLTLTSIDKQPISVMMYPNPATNETKLIISGVSGDTKIVLSDVQGRILNTINTKAINGVVEQTIDVNNLAKGVYYVRIQNSNFNRTNKLIIK